jgi:hypothetical protein
MAHKNRQAANQRHHQKTKEETDALLLRLPKGGRDRVDQMAAHFGVARPALFDLYLLPFLGVIATRQSELSSLARIAGCSMPTLLERLIHRASLDVDEAHPQERAPEVGSQFDALFGGPSVDGTPSDAGGH